MILLSAALSARTPELRHAEELYQRTEYDTALKILLPLSEKPTSAVDADLVNLIGRIYFMKGDFREAADYFQKSVTAEPTNGVYMHWLGRAYGRRAETSNPFIAPGLAAKARQYFEKAIELDPKNQEAMNDLFAYYLEAPGILGGGLEKASALARRIGQLDTAEGHFAQAVLSEKRKESATAEQHFRRAIELAPRQVGRVVDLAKFLAKQGRVQESEAVFTQAEKMAPNSPKVLFERASTYVREKRNLDQAKVLLKRYLSSHLTPEDPPREEAARLLKQAEGA